MKLKDSNNEDSLNRKEVAEKYVSLISALDGNYVIALDAPWGSGKTTLLDLMEKDLRVKNIAYINYNAWENDYLEDPFLSLISEFNNQVSEKKYLPILDKLNSLKEISYQVSKRVLPAVTKGVSQFFIGTEAVKELENGAEKIVNSLLDNTSSNVDELFKNIDNSKQSRENFNTKFKEVIKDIIDTTKYKKVVFIIDELDRCKPTFAIELLENIKHLFNIKDVVFLISVDKKQLSESIKSVYGSGFDSMTYLKRFFNFDLHLKFNSNTFFIEDKYKSFFKNGDINDIGGRELVIESFALFDLSLRDYEQILAEIYLLIEFGSHHVKYQDIFFNLLCLKYKKNYAYYYILNHRENTKIEIRDYLINNNYKNILKIINKIIFFDNKIDSGHEIIPEIIWKHIDSIESTII